MADEKLTAQTEITNPAPGDILYLVSDPAGTPVDRKVQLQNLLKISSVIQATTDTLTVAEVSGTIINNYGQTVENTQTLPAAEQGLNFIGQVGTAGAGALHFKAGAIDKIYFDGTALDDADKVSCATPAVGDYITFWTFQTGASAYDWIAVSGNGTWTDGGA